MVSVSTSSDAQRAATAPRRVDRVIRFNIGCAVVVWTMWVLLGGSRAFDAVRHYWRVSLTMVLGSLVGGGTSEGGGAVSFPVMTKAMHVAPPDARMFSFLIQSVGMSAAALSILYSRRHVERRVLAHCIPFGVLGGILSVLSIAPHVSGAQVRIAFSTALVGLALVLVATYNRAETAMWHQLPDRLSTPARLVLFTVGFAGGLLSGLLGVGENLVAFAVLVLFFRLSVKVATPTTVVMMASVSTACALTHVLVVRDVPATVVDYWLAAVPVVVIGAPVGALITAHMSGRLIRTVLITLICVDALTTVLLVPITSGSWILAGIVLGGTALGCSLLAGSTRYAQQRPQHG